MIIALSVLTSVFAINYNQWEIENYSNIKESVDSFISKIDKKISNYSLDKKINVLKWIKNKIVSIYSKVEWWKNSESSKELYRIILWYMESKIDEKIEEITSNAVDLWNLFWEIYDVEWEDNSYDPRDFNKMSLNKVNEIKEWTYMLWDSNAEITYVEYSDLECPFCKRLHQNWTIEAILENYNWKVNYIFKHFPLNFHPMAAMEAEAMECVWELWWSSKYYDFLELVFDNSKTNWYSYTIDSISDLSSEVWLNSSEVKSCLESWKYKDKVSSSYNEWMWIWVTWTPWNVLINNKTWEYILMPWAHPYWNFKSQIDSLFIK